MQRDRRQQQRSSSNGNGALAQGKKKNAQITQAPGFAVCIRAMVSPFKRMRPGGQERTRREEEGP